MKAAIARLPALLGAALTLTLPPIARAEIDGDAPVVIVMNERAFVTTGGGLIGGLIGNAANKVADAQVTEFLDRTAGVDWAKLVADEFACFAIARPPAGNCRDVIMADDGTSLDDLLAARGAQRVVVVELLQTFRVAIRYRARAVIRDFSRGKNGFKEDRAFTALYETILPMPLWDTSVPEASTWWAEGSPSRLEAEARRSLRELRELLELIEPLIENTRSAPKDWKELPKVATLVQAGRARCNGLPCGDVRVLEEHAGRTWLVNDRPLLPAYGPSIASLDDNALLNQTNLFYLISVPH